MVVVDNTVIVDFWVGIESSQAQAKRLFSMDSEWIAPDLWRYEFGNVMRKLVRLEMISDAMKDIAWEQSLIMLKTIHDINVLEIDEIAAESGLKFYDASYVWLARHMNLVFYTRDRKILESCADVAASMPDGG
jgi:predicted nucleic acid-binding protein